MKYKFIILFVLLSMRINAQFTLLSSLVYGGYESLPASYNYDGVCPSGGTRFTDYDCATEDFSNATNVALLDTNDFTEVIYINPDWGGTQSGTYLEPYDSWNDISTYITNYAYVQKRGTTCSITGTINIPHPTDNIYFGAYGNGIAPVIHKTTNGKTIDSYSQRMIIRDLNIRGISETAKVGNEVIYFHGSSHLSIVYNCEISYGYIGFFTWADDNRILNTKIHHMYLDGIWAGEFDFIEIANCHIYDINKAYQDSHSESVSGGDNIQFAYNWSQAWIHNNIIDKSTDGNKACIMMINDGTRYDEKVIIEFNTLYGPPFEEDGSDGSTIHCHDSENFLIQYNHFIGKEGSKSKGIGIWNESENDTILGNIFENYHIAIQGTGKNLNSVIAHNTFYGNDTAISFLDAKLYNNIFSIGEGDIVFDDILVDHEDQNLFTGTIHGSFPNSFQGNPLYTDSLNSDFSLRIGSDAIDSAVVLPYYEYDITKKEITGTPDCGAHEH